MAEISDPRLSVEVSSSSTALQTLCNEKKLSLSCAASQIHRHTWRCKPATGSAPNDSSPRLHTPRQRQLLDNRWSSRKSSPFIYKKQTTESVQSITDLGQNPVGLGCTLKLTYDMISPPCNIKYNYYCIVQGGPGGHTCIACVIVLHVAIR